MKESEFQRKIKFAIFSPRKFVKKYLKRFFDFVFPKNLRFFRIRIKYLIAKRKFDKEMEKKDFPKVLVVVNHYYSKKNIKEFPGKSAKQDAQIRKGIVEKVLTEWMQFRNLDFKKIKKLLKKPVIFDGRNLYDKEYLRENDFEYFSIGRYIF